MAEHLCELKKKGGSSGGILANAFICKAKVASGSSSYTFSGIDNSHLYIVVNGTFTVGAALTSQTQLIVECMINNGAIIYKTNNTNGFKNASLSGDTLSFNVGGTLNKSYSLMRLE